MVTRALQKLFKRVDGDGYGPRKRNPIYETMPPNGVTYRVRRHKWTIPASRWAWSASPVRAADGRTLSGAQRDWPQGTRTVYGDTLEDVAFVLGSQLEEGDEEESTENSDEEEAG